MRGPSQRPRISAIAQPLTAPKKISEPERGGGGEASGFLDNLPPQSGTFFDRTYEQFFPKPLQTVIGGSFQKGYLLFRAAVRPNMGILVRDFSFQVFQASGIGQAMSVPVEPGNLSQFMGFEFTIGGRWSIDMSNNNQGAGSPLINTTGQKGITNFDVSVLSRFDPIGSSAARRYGYHGQFAVYGWPGQEMLAKYWVFRQPPVEVQRVRFRINGWTMNDEVMRRIIAGK